MLNLGEQVARSFSEELVKVIGELDRREVGSRYAR
jgi:hypothetical protein